MNTFSSEERIAILTVIREYTVSDAFSSPTESMMASQFEQMAALKTSTIIKATNDEFDKALDFNAKEAIGILSSMSPSHKADVFLLVNKVSEAGKLATLSKNITKGKAAFLLKFMDDLEINSANQ